MSMFSSLSSSALRSPRRPARSRGPGGRPGRVPWGLRVAAVLVLGLAALTAGAADDRAPLDLNRATTEQLEALPGIGSVKAAAIVAHREARGGFGSLAELEAVHGIGPALAARLRPMLVLGDSGGDRPGGAAGAATAKPAR